MTEDRKKELARSFFENATDDVDGDVWELVCTVAAEAWKGGIEEYERVMSAAHPTSLVNIKRQAERLKEQG
jgi:hypothetical protein